MGSFDLRALRVVRDVRVVPRRWAGVAVLGASALGAAADGAAVPPAVSTWTIAARTVATGLPGANGVRQVGRFHTGGPFTSNPEFLLQTQAGRVLDPQRVLVALQSNLGAALGNPAHASGTVLSIDTRPAADGRPLAVAPNLALLPGGATAGALQIYSAQSARNLNRVHNSGSRTAVCRRVRAALPFDQQRLRPAVDRQRAVRPAR